MSLFAHRHGDSCEAPSCGFRVSAMCARCHRLIFVAPSHFDTRPTAECPDAGLTCRSEMSER